MSNHIRHFAYVCLLVGWLASSVDAQFVVAHRGASADAPENTVAAFDLAWEKGADAIEGDFQLTKDGRIIALHDKDLNRVAGVKRKASAMTLAELKKLDVGSWKGKRFQDERIPTLHQVLATVPAGKKIFVEIKDTARIVPKLKLAFENAYKASIIKPSQITVICFNVDVIAKVRQHIPRVTACWLVSYRQDKKTGKWNPGLDGILAKLKAIRGHGLDVNASSGIDDAFVRQCRKAGYQLHCWTVNDAKTATRFGELGFDSITTDRPAWLARHLKRDRQAD